MNLDDVSHQLAALHAEAFGWALYCCRGDHALAEEALQNAYVKWLEGRLRHDGASSLKTWWLGVIRLTAHEEFRRRRIRDSTLLRWLRGSLAEDEEPQDPAPHPARCAELDEESARLRRLLARLPARQGEVLHLVFYEGLTLADAAAVMGVGLGSARKYYDLGKSRLRAWLEQENRP
jgi:RNA polymerase sigma-70 factor (ECF subfamily)